MYGKFMLHKSDGRMAYSDDKYIFPTFLKDVPHCLCIPHPEHMIIVQKISYMAYNSESKAPILTAIILGAFVTK
jgi:hypothetical protein